MLRARGQEGVANLFCRMQTRPPESVSRKKRAEDDREKGEKGERNREKGNKEESKQAKKRKKFA